MEQTVKEYKCPCCSGAIEFNSSKQKMVCPYCDTEFSAETLEDFATNIDETGEDDMNWETASGTWEESDGGMAAYICRSCAGQIIAEETTAATFCPFCGNPVVMSGRLSGDLRPDLVIPFKVDRDAAVTGLRDHLSGKRLLPKVFKDENHINEVKGVYVPFWLYDADADATIRYRARKVRHWSDSMYDYTETAHFSVFRKGSLSFDGVPVDGSRNMPDDLMESIEPFDYRDAVDFSTAYLSGFFADKYDVSGEECITRANQRIKNSTEAAIRSTVKGYTSVTPEASSVSFSGGKTKYALLPVWLLSTKWKGKDYLFAMNGQTGKFVGNLPLDRGAYWKWFGIIFGAVAAVTFLVTYLMALL